MSIQVGLIGAGFISGIHQRNLAQDARVEVAAIYDVDAKRAGALAVASVEELFAKCDAIYIASPNTTHADLAVRALEAGKHVFCEKPMATTVEDARRAHAAAEAASTVFQVGHNRRFAPAYRRMAEILHNCEAHCAHIKMNRGELLNPAWTTDPAVTGGFLFETPIHMFDMMRFQFGEIVGIDAREGRKDDFSCLIEFETGMYATFVTSADASWYFPYESVETYGPYATIQTFEMEAIEYRLGLGQPTCKEHFANLDVPAKWGFADEDRRFIDAIEKKAKSAVTSYDGLRSVEIAGAGDLSAAERRRVGWTPRVWRARSRSGPR